MHSAAAVGGNFPHSYVLLIGIANLLGDAISMGLGDYFSEHSEQAHAAAAFKIEQKFHAVSLSPSLLSLYVYYFVAKSAERSHGFYR